LCDSGYIVTARVNPNGLHLHKGILHSHCARRQCVLTDFSGEAEVGYTLVAYTEKNICSFY